MSEMPMINLVDENGTKVSKDKLRKQFSDFKKKIMEIYKTMPNEIEDNDEPASLTEAILDPSFAIDFNQVANTYNFYDRGIFISDAITSEIVPRVVETIKIYNALDNDCEIPVEERKPIKIYINSPGGELYSAFSIVNAIKASKTPIHAYVLGSAYSGGFLITIACNKRFAYPYSSFMFHEGSCCDEGDAQKMIQRIEFYKQELDRMKTIVLENTSITEKDYDEHRKDDWFMNTYEAKKYGIIDEIIEDKEGGI